MVSGNDVEIVGRIAADKTFVNPVPVVKERFVASSIFACAVGTTWSGATESAVFSGSKQAARNELVKMFGFDRIASVFNVQKKHLHEKNDTHKILVNIAHGKNFACFKVRYRL